jgi:hypothetical protein
MGDELPKRIIIVEWLKWIDPAGSPYSGLGQTRGPKPSFVAFLHTSGLQI